MQFPKLDTAMQNCQAVDAQNYSLDRTLFWNYSCFSCQTLLGKIIKIDSAHVACCMHAHHYCRPVCTLFCPASVQDFSCLCKRPEHPLTDIVVVLHIIQNECKQAVNLPFQALYISACSPCSRTFCPSACVPWP